MRLYHYFPTLGHKGEMFEVSVFVLVETDGPPPQWLVALFVGVGGSFTHQEISKDDAATLLRLGVISKPNPPQLKSPCPCLTHLE